MDRIVEIAQSPVGSGRFFVSVPGNLHIQRSPWQNPYAERVIGSIRRECLDHKIILGERHLKRILSSYIDYYHGARTHLSLAKDAPAGRLVQPTENGWVVELKQAGGLHHLYAKMAA